MEDIKILTVETGVASLIFAELRPQMVDFYLGKDKSGTYLLWSDGKVDDESFVIGEHGVVHLCDDPRNNWKQLDFYKDVTWQRWERILEPRQYGYYHNYGYINPAFKHVRTLQESLDSLLTVNGIGFDGPDTKWDKERTYLFIKVE